MKYSSIYSRVPLNGQLVDKRLETAGNTFGVVSKLAKQYGIEVTRIAGRLHQFSAPKKQLMKLKEAFHFSKVNYWE